MEDLSKAKSREGSVVAVRATVLGDMLNGRVSVRVAGYSVTVLDSEVLNVISVPETDKERADRLELEALSLQEQIHGLKVQLHALSDAQTPTPACPIAAVVGRQKRWLFVDPIVTEVSKNEHDHS